VTGLHVYSPSMWHDEVGIVGTRDALVLLRAAIDDALTDGQSTFETFAADGEGYDLHVVCVEPEDMDGVQLPYTDHVARKRGSSAHWTELLTGTGDDHA
jgi:hypothetical protein